MYQGSAFLCIIRIWNIWISTFYTVECVYFCNPHSQGLLLLWRHMSVMASLINRESIVWAKLFRLTYQKISKVCTTSPFVGGNQLVTGGCPSRWTSSAERISMSWRHDVIANRNCLCPHYTCSRSCPDLGFCPDRKTTAIERDKRELIITWSC